MLELTVYLLISPILMALFTLVAVKLSGVVKREVEDVFEEQWERLAAGIAGSKPGSEYELVGLEKRLQVHQELYLLAQEMIRSAYATEEDRDRMIARIKQFRDRSTLYLKPEVLGAFNQATIALLSLGVYHAAIEAEPVEDMKRHERVRLEERIATVRNLSEVLSNSFHLEPFPMDDVALKQLKEQPKGYPFFRTEALLAPKAAEPAPVDVQADSVSATV